MKLKIIVVGILLLMSVFAGGCLNSSSDDTSTTVCDINEINSNRKSQDYYSGQPIAVDCTDIKTVSFFSNPDNRPNDNLSVRAYKFNSISSNVDYVSYDPVNVTNWSDVVVYGTVKEVRSFWTTPDGAEPNLGEIQTREWMNYLTNETESEEYLDAGSYEIYTYVYFTVDERVKGETPDVINLYLPGGQVGNVVMYGGDFPKYWDFKEGEQYLLYLEEYSDEYDLIMPSGIRKVVP
ncbi:hypothetical protein [Methanolapillus millepedarum]|uniref:Uncharacterized protein n=1 Tax=Methanolapillus millepedarum TaxID=3028296 RepID=A0AA96V2V7_9EURY|nr:hypothetical protein MsAc7_10340 [Methanosarcinaceae archaeon Ac7]